MAEVTLQDALHQDINTSVLYGSLYLLEHLYINISLSPNINDKVKNSVHKNNNNKIST